MKKILLLIIVVTGIVTAFAQTDSSECGKLRTGKFYYLDTPGNKVLVTRMNKRQKEYNTVTKVTTYFKVSWTSACTYELKQSSTNSRSGRKNNRGISAIVISKILPNGYESGCSCKDEKDRKMITMIKTE